MSRKRKKGPKPRTAARKQHSPPKEIRELATRVTALEEKWDLWARLPLVVSFLSLIAFVLDMALFDTLKFKDSLANERYIMESEHNFELTYHILGPHVHGSLSDESEEEGKHKFDVTVMNLGVRDMKAEDEAKLKVAFTEIATWKITDDLNDLVRDDDIEKTASAHGYDWEFTLYFDSLGSMGEFRIVFNTDGKLVYLPILSLGNANFDPTLCEVDSAYVIEEESCSDRIRDRS